jgi:hypothetical protein
VLLVIGSYITIAKIDESDFKFINGFIQNENLFITSSNLINFTIFGLLLCGLNVFMIWRDKKRIKKKLDTKEHEVMALKAQLFDLSPGTAPAPPATTESDDASEPQAEE